MLSFAYNIINNTPEVLAFKINMPFPEERNLPLKIILIYEATQHDPDHTVQSNGAVTIRILL